VVYSRAETEAEEERRITDCRKIKNVAKLTGEIIK
jgi:hypothetical protein